MCVLYANNCTPIISACQEIFLWYSIDMRRLLLLLGAIAITIGIVPSQGSPPKERVVQSDGTANAKNAAKARQERESTAEETIKAMLAQIQQRNAEILAGQTKQNNQEIEIEGKLVKYTRWLVIVGALQGAVLLLTVWVIRRQTNFFRNSERAWVLVETVEIRREAGGRALIYPIIKNLGKTIARIRKVSYGGARPLPYDEELPELPVFEGSEKYNFVLCPNQEFKPFHIPVNSGNMFSIQKGILRQYLLGCVEYLDLSGKKRTTNFCLASFVGEITGDVIYRTYLEAPPAYNKAT